MSIEQGVLRYLGVTPVLPNREFVGAKESDGFSGQWQIKVKRSREAVVPQKNSEQTVANRQALNALVLNDLSEKNGQHADKKPAPAKVIENFTSTVDSVPQVNSQALVSNPPESSVAISSTSQSSENSALKIKFNVHVFQLLPLNVLVLAEFDASASSAMELTFLKKILKSFSADQTPFWQYAVFSWPPKQQGLTHLDASRDAAVEVFRGYLESKQNHAPQHLLCFSQSHLNNILGIEEGHKEKSLSLYTEHDLQGLWPETKAVVFSPTLSDFMRKKDLKKRLWEYIQTHLLSD